MHPRAICTTFFLLISGCCCVDAIAQNAETEPETNRFDLKSERVVVFKDGYCMVIKHGTATTDANGIAFSEDVPDAAVLGTFWSGATKGTIESMTAGWQSVHQVSEEQLPCTQTIDVIAANLGKTCTFTLNGMRIQGQIEQVMTTTTEQSIDPSQLRLVRRLEDPFAATRFDSGLGRTVTRNQGDQFVLRTEQGHMLVSASLIQQLVIPDMATTLKQTVTTTGRKKRLRWKFDQPNASVEIRLMYFRPGVRWIPTYQVDLDSRRERTSAGKSGSGGPQKEPTANLSLQGLVINEAEDFANVPFDVVVGVPNFRFRETPSPLALESVMRNTIAAAEPQLMGQNRFSNGIYAQRMSEFRSSRADGQPDANVEMPDELSGEGTNDLYVYHLPKLSLMKGERVSVPILTTKVRYRDIYTWDINLKHTESMSPTESNEQSPLLLSENKIWRQIELVNDTNMPWTTGAAMLVDGVQPLAQELLTYTSPGGMCRVPVTVAVDARGKVDDTETGRQVDNLVWRNSHYTRVDGRIDIEVANNKNVAIPVEVRLRFGGRAEQTTHDGLIRLSNFRPEDWDNYRGEPAVNNSSTVIWKATIEPGECFEPQVTYGFYLRH